MINYTVRERTIKQNTVADVLANVRMYLDARGHHDVGICLDDIKYVVGNVMLTIEESNRLMEAVIDTSLYYAGK